jgi:hypothetical protein
LLCFAGWLLLFTIFVRFLSFTKKTGFGITLYM